MLLSAILVIVAVAGAAILLSPRIRDNRVWRATVTPLASIIGSGFLVIVPLLGHAVGAYAPLAMASIVIVACLIGSAIRFNIRHSEKFLSNPAHSRSLATRLDAVSDVALSIGYFISVAFYLRLLSAFALHSVAWHHEILAKGLTTLILLFIGGVGWFRGLAFLERLEEYSVSIKLAIIMALIVGWSVYDVGHLADTDIGSLVPARLEGWHVLRLLAGALIVVQGFETSRYLGTEYKASLRSATMRNAQLISGVIYLVFVALTVPTFSALGTKIDDTAIIALSSLVSSTLPVMLVVAALMSQFSAAVADTVGAAYSHKLSARSLEKPRRLAMRS